MRVKSHRYALCVEVEADEDLEVRKVYEVLPDALAESRGHLRVIDESGEDYLYPADAFVVLRLPERAETALRRRLVKPSAKHANKRLQPARAKLTTSAARHRARG